jgi:hypothetical protein
MVRRIPPRAALGVMAAVLLVEGVAHTTTWYGAHEERGALPALPALAAPAQSGRVIRYTPELTQLPPLAADVPMAYGWVDASGWAVFLPRDVDRYMNIVENHGAFARLTNVEPPLTEPNALNSPLLDAFDVSTVLVDPGISGPLPLPTVGHIAAMRIATRGSALGPATLVRDAVPATDAQSWRRLRAQPDLATTAAVVGLPAALHDGGGTVQRVAATADTERYHVRATGPSLLRVSGRYDRGWRAEVDGRPQPVLRADGLFRSVVVPAGDHVVDWRYRNPDAATGRAVGALALAACLALLVSSLATRASASRSPDHRRGRGLRRRPRRV